MARSVGNNLNDIAKDHPERVVEVCRSWLPGRDTLVRRGVRTLIKQGDPQALALLGYGDADVSARAQLPERIVIGDKLPIVVELSGDGQVLVDLVVYYVKANGSVSRKVFKGAEVEVRGTAVVRRTISFAQHTTRRHYPGAHRIAVLINGRELDVGVVRVGQS